MRADSDDLSQRDAGKIREIEGKFGQIDRQQSIVRDKRDSRAKLSVGYYSLGRDRKKRDEPFSSFLGRRDEKLKLEIGKLSIPRKTL